MTVKRALIFYFNCAIQPIIVALVISLPMTALVFELFRDNVVPVSLTTYAIIPPLLIIAGKYFVLFHDHLGLSRYVARFSRGLFATELSLVFFIPLIICLEGFGSSFFNSHACGFSIGLSLAYLFCNGDMEELEREVISDRETCIIGIISNGIDPFSRDDNDAALVSYLVSTPSKIKAMDIIGKKLLIGSYREKIMPGAIAAISDGKLVDLAEFVMGKIADETSSAA